MSSPLLLFAQFCQVTNKGPAMKIEEYAPQIIPTINVNEKYFKVSTKNKNNETITSNVVTTVEMDLPTV